jgi:thioredoxin 1
VNKVINIENEEEFFEILNQEDKPVIIDFYAEWCAPCKSLFPVFEALPEEMDNKITVLKVDIEKQAKIAALFLVRSVPTVVTTSRAEVVRGVVGGKTPNFYKEMAESAIFEHNKK